MRVLPLACFAVAFVSLWACSSSDPAATPGGADPGGTSSKPKDSSDPGSDPSKPAACTTACADGTACTDAAQCTSGVCTGGTCAAATHTDTVKNGDETDVDCGGSSPTKCDAAKACKVDADCTSEGCRDGVCAIRKSCKQVAGGNTCGTGEVGDATAQHEDCCTVLDVPRPAADGGPYKLDKYLITAGRMRQFFLAVNNDLKTYVTKDPPAGWSDTWTKSVPGDEDELLQIMGPGEGGATSYGSGSLGQGCYMQDGGSANSFWMSKADADKIGDLERQFSQEEMDAKVMNCATHAMFAAFCHWDGGRLPSLAEWQYAVNGGDKTHKYPWGTDFSEVYDNASYNGNYQFPTKAIDYDNSSILPAPGRFPKGVGPFGHMDLLGGVENFTDTGGVMQYSFQEAGADISIKYGTERADWPASTKHYAIGARCARD